MKKTESSEPKIWHRWLFTLLSIIIGVGLGIYAFEQHFSPADMNLLKSILYVLFVLLGIGITLYHQFHNNPQNRKEFVTFLKNLDKHEVIFWSPALLFVSSICVLMSILGIFLSWGYHDGMLMNLYQLFLSTPSIWPILTIIPVPFLLYAIAKKSFLKTIIFNDLVAIPVLFTLDFYQKNIQEPYSLGYQLFNFAGLAYIFIFFGGFIFIYDYWSHKDQAKEELKLAKY